MIKITASFGAPLSSPLMVPRPTSKLVFHVDSDLRKSESLIDFFVSVVIYFSTTVNFFYNTCNVCCVSWGSSEKQLQMDSDVHGCY